MWRAINVGVAVIAFAATCLALHALLPSPDVGRLSFKLRFLAQHRDDYDTIFIGSSRTFHGVSPKIFDEVTVAAGLPCRSFNMADDGLLPPEQFFLLDQILKLRPTKWRWVFIELDDVQVRLAANVEGTGRAVYWHDWRQTGLVYRKLLGFDKLNLKRSVKRAARWYDALCTPADLFLKNLGNVGRFESVGRADKSDAQRVVAGELGPNGDGFHPANVTLDAAKAHAYEAWLAAEAAKPRRHVIDVFADEAYRSYAQRFRALGVTPIFFVTPGSMSMLPSRFNRDPAPTLLAFNNVDAYPGLYQTAARLDESHLNGAGAEQFSRLLAQRFLEVLGGAK